jgi:hypothetical protein
MFRALRPSCWFIPSVIGRIGSRPLAITDRQGTKSRVRDSFHSREPAQLCRVSDIGSPQKAP